MATTLTFVYAVIGNCAQCVPSVNQKSSPNGDVRADGMANQIVLSIATTAVDPYLSSWIDPTTTVERYTCVMKSSNITSTGASYNVLLSGKKYFIYGINMAGRTDCLLSPKYSTPVPYLGGPILSNPTVHCIIII